MEHLRKLIIALNFVLLPGLLAGQSHRVLVNAFSSSYRLAKEGKYTEAINVLKKQYGEDHYELNLRLGWLSYQAGFFTESLSYYNNCINLRSFAIEPRLGIAYPAGAMGNWELVIDQYNKILEITPNNSIVLYRLGSIYYGRKEYELAESYLQKVVNLYPFDYDGLILLAWTKLQMKKTNEAIVLFQKVQLYNPGDESAAEGLKLLE